MVELFGIDRRATAMFRIGLGAMLIADLVKRSLALEAHYTDAGVLPRAMLGQYVPDPLIFRAYLWSGEWIAQVCMFWLAGLCALCVSLGLFTRLATALSLFMLVSLQVRNPLVCHTGDLLLTTVTLWSVFLPLGSYFSLDRLRKPSMPMAPRQVATVGTAGYLVQIAIFYLGAGLLKHREEVWTSGRAVSVFLSFDSYTTPIGAALADMEGLARFVTYFTLVMEIGGPILLFCPFFTRIVRTVMVVLFVGFHLGIQLTVHIGIFEILSIIAVSAFLPGWAFDQLESRIRWPRWMTRAAAYARAWALSRSPGEPSAARAQARLPAFLAWECVAGLVLVGVCWFNYKSSVVHEQPKFPKPGTTLFTVTRFLSIDQAWSIFTNLDKHREGWFVVVAELADGSKFDVLQARPFTGMQKPEHFAASYDNHNWRRYWNAMVLKPNRPFVIHLARYVAREWVEDGGAPLEALAIYHVGSRSGQAEEPKLFIRYQPKLDPLNEPRARLASTEAASARVPPTPMKTAGKKLYDIPLQTLAGEPTTLAEQGGKALLIVNVASQCGMTPQYAQLEALQKSYGPRGLTVVGFPCNQFGGQEPGSPEEIREFCSSEYGVSFPLMAKIEVNGAGRHPLYKELTAVADASGTAGDVQWNFEKFLVSANGQKIQRFRPRTKPDAPEVIAAIEAALPAP
jgi:glutathione peroxidase